MAAAIFGQNVSVAWLDAFQFLLEKGRDIPNLAVTIEHPLEENAQIRVLLDQFIAAQRSQKPSHRVEPISTVANTIFPSALYLPRLGPKASAHLYEMSGLARSVSRRRNRLGTYFERLVAWPKDGHAVNQLEKVVSRIKSARTRGRAKENSLEIGIAEPCDSEMPNDQNTAALPIYSPGRDNGIMGFPCLSHISLSLVDGTLHMTALYRNHEFVRRAYGNYVGLGRLLGFIANESGSEVGELMCVSSHADPEIGHGSGFGANALRRLLADCHAARADSSQSRGA